MIRLQVPEVGPLVVSYAGGEPITYVPDENGVVEVQDRHLEDFLAAVPGSRMAPPPSAEPAPAKGKRSAEPARESE